MKKMFFVILMLSLLNITYSQERFEAGTFEVSDIKTFIDEKDFIERHRDLLALDKKDENLIPGNRNIVLDEKTDMFRYSLLSDELAKFTYVSIFMGENSYNLYDANYYEKSLNYLWSGNIRRETYDVIEINGKSSEFTFGLDYDDTWGPLTFSTENFFTRNKIDHPGPVTARANSYYRNEKHLNLSGNGYYTKIKDWNFNGRISRRDKTLSSSFAGGLNDRIKNTVFDGKAIRQFDLSHKSFMDITLNLKFDSLKTTTINTDNDRFDMIFDFHIVETRYAVKTTLGFYTADYENQTAFIIDYSMFKSDDETVKFALGKRYSPNNFEKIYFDKDIVIPAPGKLRGESADFVEAGYDFIYKGADLSIKIGNESISDKYYFFDLNPGDRAYSFAAYNSIDRFYFNLNASQKLSDELALKAEYNFSDYSRTMPYVVENTWKVGLDYSYSEHTKMELEGVFTGKYKNDIVAAVENDNSILVNFLVNHALSDKLGFRLAVNNMFDKNFTEKPGYSEDKYRRRIKIGMIYNF
ncbi:MAG: hypothetical protein WC002_03700 [Candidatus Muiribacteriota bacterium]